MHDYRQPWQVELDRTKRKLQNLEAELQQLRRLREAKQDVFRQVRWCITSDPVSPGTYPSNNGATAYPIRFIDADFTAAAGVQTFHYAARSTDSVTVAFAPKGRYIPTGTPLPVFWMRGLGDDTKGDWWLLDEPQLYLGQASGAISSGGTGSVARLFGGTEGSAGVTDTVVNKWPDIDDASFVIYAKIDGTLYVVAPSGGGGGSSTPSYPLYGVPFLNNSGMDIPPHAVMHVPDSIETDKVYLLAEQPGNAYSTVWLINGATTVPNLTTSRGRWSDENTGPIAISQGVDPVDEIGWGAAPGSWELQPCRPGFDCLNTTSRTVGGQRVTDFIQRQQTRVYGKLKGDLDMTQFPGGDASAEFEIWHRGSDNKMRPSGWPTLEVFAPFFNKKDKALKGTWGVADWYSNHWEGDYACDKDDKDTAQQSPAANQGAAPLQGGDGALGGLPFVGGGVGTGTGTI